MDLIYKAIKDKIRKDIGIFLSMKNKKKII